MKLLEGGSPTRPSDPCALSFHGVTKTYRGGKVALDDLSFEIPRGVISGFVGPNGAGKTTTFSVVSGFLAPDKGTMRVLDQDGFDPWALKGRLGVLPQDAELSDRHTPTELLVHLGQLQGMSRRDARTQADRFLKLVRLDDRARNRIASLSHGMRRRVAVASALMGSPELVLLDEPMAGLDPLQAKSLREALRELRGEQTLVVSSHNLDELERLCDHVVMIDQGRCLRQGPIAEITGVGATVEWTLSGAPPMDQLANLAHDFTWDGTTLIETAPQGADLDASSVRVLSILAEHGVGVREVQRGMGLERRFLQDLV